VLDYPHRDTGSPVQAGVDRRATRHAATKGEILQAAWTLSRRDGLASVSMRELAASVGMRAPSLYQYFPSKAAIYDGMFGQAAQQVLDAVSDAIDGRRGVDALREGARRIVEFATSDPVRAELLFQRTIPGFEPSSESYAPSVEMRGRVEAVVDEMGIGDPDAMDLWTALMSGLSNQQLANDPGGTRWTRLVDRSVDMFLNYVTTDPRSERSSKKTARKET
jgi:AcrR family transcriptional regulator